MKHPRETVDDAQGLYEGDASLSVAAIAERVGVAERTVSRWAAAAGWLRAYSSEVEARHRGEIADRARMRALEGRELRASAAAELSARASGVLLEALGSVDVAALAGDPQLLRAVGGIYKLAVDDLQSLDAVDAVIDDGGGSSLDVEFGRLMRQFEG